MSPLVRRTWAVAGQTPLLPQRTAGRQNISAAGAIAISPRRRRLSFLFRLHPAKTIKQAEAIAFLRALLGHLRGPIVLLWDRLPVHRGRQVETFLQQHRRLHVEHFPAYAPELNPIEYAWSWLKTNPLANRTATDLGQLTDQVLDASGDLFDNQQLLRGFIKATKLPFRFP